MDITDLTRPLDGPAVSEFLRSLPARPLLLGLGEARHFVQELGELRNDLFRHLVEHEGYRSFAIESDCLRALLVDDHVTKGTGTLDDVMEHGFSHRFGTIPANRALVHWMRAHNESHEEKLRFFGVDAPLEYWAESPRQALTALYDLLEDPLPHTRETLDDLLGPDARWTNRATVMDPAQSIGRTPEARRLRLIADDLTALLETRLPALAPHDRERAALYARTATGLLRYHHWMADPSPLRISHLSALRDAQMAANLQAAATHHGPTLAYAHNLHLQRTMSTMSLGPHPLTWWSAGALARTHLSPRYAFLATSFGTLAGDGPPPGTLEAVLSTHPASRTLTPTRSLTLPAPVPPRRRTSDPAYFPLDPTHLHDPDALIHLRSATPQDPT
ncbi:erythromycin esterase family protein [Actinocorallia longicatena]|uniref:Erythromycin esterase family protein n=1 Tax=Actinocorallia longicatena TaxID=111803 RepID=A0ABP6QA96_9ACTN